MSWCDWQPRTGQFRNYDHSKRWLKDSAVLWSALSSANLKNLRKFLFTQFRSSSVITSSITCFHRYMLKCANTHRPLLCCASKHKVSENLKLWLCGIWRCCGRFTYTSTILDLAKDQSKKRCASRKGRHQDTRNASDFQCQFHENPKKKFIYFTVTARRESRESFSSSSVFICRAISTLFISLAWWQKSEMSRNLSISLSILSSP